ncbi:sensor histidine kinase [Pseudobdellovibrio exovorus]|uniref:histidine kinase n=1 Tax=Pseudobdellovibrio exovorus JSS TaxID=1184267 RepID=M4V6X0_9BACT|nr:sensor histidine kinase [Pseudobdellovibrio exovorus]AGH95122.1 hypothetical protein A11Q_906 [Pseudobdellovibrio exovorus JSS]
MKKYIFLLISLTVFSTLIQVALFFNLTNQTNIISNSILPLLQRQDYANLKIIMTPLLSISVKKMSIFSNAHLIFEVSSKKKSYDLLTFNRIIESNNQSYKIVVVYKNSLLAQYLLIGLLMGALIFFIYRSLMRNIEFKIELANLMQAVAHDIRSPLSTLKLITSKINQQEIQKIQIDTINRIEDIANQLLLYTRPSKKETSANAPLSLPLTTPPTTDNILNIFERLQKEYVIRNISLKNKAQFSTESDLQNFSITNTAALFLYRSINNCVQNSQEASQNDDLVQIHFSVINNHLQVTITDHGRGIPPHILKVLGEKPLSFGKTNSENTYSGHGIALYTMHQEAHRIGASIRIISNLGEGTQVLIIIPIS